MHLHLHTYHAYTLHNQRHIHIPNIVINILEVQKSAIIAYMLQAYPTLSTDVWSHAYGKYGSNFMHPIERRMGKKMHLSAGEAVEGLFSEKGVCYTEIMYCIEDLRESGLRIAVEKPGFTYGHDAVLLAGFARIKKQDKLLDLGCGCGILAILLERRTGAETYAVDLRPEACALTRESARLNGQHIAVLEQDLRTLALAPGQRPFDAIVCNPPYFAGGTPSPDPARRVCTHQDTATIQDVAACASGLLKHGGRLFLCYPAGGVAVCISALVEQGLSPKRLQPVAPRGKPPYLVLLEARKGGGPGLIWEPAIRV